MRGQIDFDLSSSCGCGWYHKGEGMKFNGVELHSAGSVGSVRLEAEACDVRSGG